MDICVIDYNEDSSHGALTMNAEQLIAEAEMLPVEQRAHVVERLLESLTPTDSDIANAWIEVAKTRLDDLESGRVAAIPGEEVFGRLARRIGG